MSHTLTLRLSDGREFTVSVEPWPSLDTSDEGRLRFQLFQAVTTLSRAVTGKQGPMAAGLPIGAMIDAEWRHRCAVAAYRAAMKANLGTDESEEGSKRLSDTKRLAVEAERMASEADHATAMLWHRWGDLLRWPEGGGPPEPTFIAPAPPKPKRKRAPRKKEVWSDVLIDRGG